MISTPTISTPTTTYSQDPREWQGIAWLAGLGIVFIFTIVIFATMGIDRGLSFLFMASWVVFLVAFVIVLVDAFQESVGWGLASLLFPFVIWIYLFAKYTGRKAPMAVMMASPFILGAIWVPTVVIPATIEMIESDEFQEAMAAAEANEGQASRFVSPPAKPKPRKQAPRNQARNLPNVPATGQEFGSRQTIKRLMGQGGNRDSGFSPPGAKRRPQKRARKPPIDAKAGQQAEARRAMQSLIDARPGPEVAECLTNETAANVSMQVFLDAGVRLALAPRQGMREDLAVVLDRYGINPVRANKRVGMRQLEPRGRALLGDLLAFMERWSDRYNFSAIEDMPSDLSRLRFRSIDATRVQIDGPGPPSSALSLEARLEDGRWRIHDQDAGSPVGDVARAG
jgi:hypothetical protein